MPEEEGRGRGLIWLALLLAIAAAFAVALLPTYDGTDGGKSLLEVEGGWVIPLLLLPVLLTSIPLLVSEAARRRTMRWCTLILVVLVFLTGFSIGGFFLPAMLTALVEVLRAWEPRADEDQLEPGP